jgi:hypothetical protein
MDPTKFKQILDVMGEYHMPPRIRIVEDNPHELTWRPRECAAQCSDCDRTVKDRVCQYIRVEDRKHRWVWTKKCVNCQKKLPLK